MKPKPIIFVLACSLLICGTASAETAFTNIDQGLKTAQAKQEPVFVDFSAAWCHSCHAMDAKVLNGPEWVTEQAHFVLVRSDADSVNGSTWSKKLHIPALPTYVVLNPDGSERGRLTGEIPRAKFYLQLNGILSGQDAFTKLKQDAAHGSVEAAAKVLRAYDERDQQKEGLGWFAALPSAVRKAVQGNPDAATRLAVVQANAEMRQAYYVDPRKQSATKRARLAKDCRTHAQQALRGKLDLGEHFDVAGTLLACAHELPVAQQKALAAKELPDLKLLYDKEIPSAGSGDLRDATYILAGYYKTLGGSAAEKATYQHTIAIASEALDDGHGGFDVKRDEAMAEVLDEFLDRRSVNPDKRTELLKDLMAAYPDNFFYRAEYGKDLLKRGKAAEALPYLEHAAATASDEDKLGIAFARAKALIALHRRPEAVKLFNDAMHQYEKEFPEMAKLEKQYMKLPPDSKN